MTALFVVLACFVAPPLMDKASGREAAALLSREVPRVAAETGAQPLIISYRQEYSCSLVYYSGYVPYRMAPVGEVTRAMPANGEISWNEKNVMPFLFQEDLPTQRDVLLLTDVKRKDGVLVTEATLHVELAGRWEFLGETESGQRLFLRRAAGETSDEEMGK